MGGPGVRWIWIIAVGVVIGFGSLAAVGLLPGQVSNGSVRANALAPTSIPLGGGGSTPVVPVAPTSVPASTSTSTSSSTTTSTTAPEETTTTVAAPSAADTPSATTAPATPATPSGSGSNTTPAAPSTGDTAPPADVDASDPTCSILQEVLDLVDDPAVRQAIKDEMKASGC
jgi:hypothetical protein